MTNMTEVKVSELSGRALDWAVARAEGWDVKITKGDFSRNHDLDLRCTKPRETLGYNWKPSTVWSQGGPLFEKHNIAVCPRIEGDEGEGWLWLPGTGRHLLDGMTPLIAACRAIVAVKFGDVVQVPAVLVESAA